MEQEKVMFPAMRRDERKKEVMMQIAEQIVHDIVDDVAENDTIQEVILETLAERYRLDEVQLHDALSPDEYVPVMDYHPAYAEYYGMQSMVCKDIAYYAFKKMYE
jgi:hypothetical protein